MTALDHRARVRVAVTGLGVKTPAGCDLDSFWSTLVSGESAAARLTLIDPTDLPVTFGCEVRDFDVAAYVPPKEARRLDRSSQLGVAAAADALSDAGDLGRRSRALRRRDGRGSSAVSPRSKSRSASASRRAPCA